MSEIVILDIQKTISDISNKHFRYPYYCTIFQISKKTISDMKND